MVCTMQAVNVVNELELDNCAFYLRSTHLHVLILGLGVVVRQVDLTNLLSYWS